MAHQPNLSEKKMQRSFGIDLKELKKNYQAKNFKIDSKSYFKEGAKFLTKYTLSVISDQK